MPALARRVHVPRAMHPLTIAVLLFPVAATLPIALVSARFDAARARGRPLPAARPSRPATGRVRLPDTNRKTPRTPPSIAPEVEMS